MDEEKNKFDGEPMTLESQLHQANEVIEQQRAEIQSLMARIGVHEDTEIKMTNELLTLRNALKGRRV